MSRNTFDFVQTTVLVTGASTGIGAEFARRLAERGADLVLVARSEDKLIALAAELEAAHPIRAIPVAADLSAPGAIDTLIGKVAAHGVEIDVLINNAGFGTFGDLATSDPVRIDQEIDLNVGALTSLTTRILPGLIARRHGAIINVASNAAFQPIPYMAVYAATKAYVLSFTQALWGELHGSGVRVLAVCPGPTETPFFEIAGNDVMLGSRRTTTDVVRSALRALDRGRPSVVDGIGNAFVARVATRLAPERLLIRVAGRYVSPRSSHQQL